MECDPSKRQFAYTILKKNRHSISFNIQVWCRLPGTAPLLKRTAVTIMEKNIKRANMEKRAQQCWLESLTTADLIYLKMMMTGQIQPDENDETQMRLKNSYIEALEQ